MKRVDLGIIGAMETEVAGLRDAMENVSVREISGIRFYEGDLEGHRTVCAVCGIGKVFAAVCAQTMILKWHPRAVVNTGVGGTLTDRLGIGDLAVATDVVQHDMDTSALGDPVGMVSGINVIRFPSDGTLSDLFVRCAEARGIRCVRGTIASGDRFICGAGDKRLLTERFGAVACEMEGGAVGHVCYVNRVPFCVLRAISDEADGTSPSDYGAFAAAAAARSVAVLRDALRIMK